MRQSIYMFLLSILLACGIEIGIPGHAQGQEEQILRVRGQRNNINCLPDSSIPASELDRNGLPRNRYRIDMNLHTYGGARGHLDIPSYVSRHLPVPLQNFPRSSTQTARAIMRRLMSGSLMAIARRFQPYLPPLNNGVDPEGCNGFLSCRRSSFSTHPPVFVNRMPTIPFNFRCEGAPVVGDISESAFFQIRRSCEVNYWLDGDYRWGGSPDNGEHRNRRIGCQGHRIIVDVGPAGSLAQSLTRTLVLDLCVMEQPDGSMNVFTLQHHYFGNSIDSNGAFSGIVGLPATVNNGVGGYRDCATHVNFDRLERAILEQFEDLRAHDRSYGSTNSQNPSVSDRKVAKDVVGIGAAAEHGSEKNPSSAVGAH